MLQLLGNFIVGENIIDAPKIENNLVHYQIYICFSIMLYSLLLPIKVSLFKLLYCFPHSYRSSNFYIVFHIVIALPTIET